MIKVNVARSPEEAELQAKGVDVMASLYERDDAGFTEAYDPNAEPGEILPETAAEAAVEAATEPAAEAESVAEPEVAAEPEAAEDQPGE